MPQPFQGNLADDGDGGRMHELCDVGSDKRGSHQDVSRAVYDQHRVAAVVLACQRRPCDLDVEFGDDNIDARVVGGTLGQPDRPDLRLGR